MATETKVPDGLLTSDNLTGGLSAIDTDDTTWLVASSNNSNSVVAVSFPTPTGNPNTGAGLQNFTVKYRVTANGSNVDFNAYLRENGTRINGGTAIDSWSSTSTTEVTREIAWNASLLGTADGSLVELEVVATKSGGSPSNRTTGEFQFIDWDVDYSTASTITGSGTPASQAATMSGTGEITKTGTGALQAQSSSVAGTATVSRVGSGALQAQSATVSGTAERTLTGSGTLSAGSSTVSGTGTVGAVTTGSGALQAQSSAVSGTAERVLTASGSLTAQSSSVSGTAEIVKTSSGSLTSQTSSVSGTATVSGSNIGTGSLEAQSSTLSGSGTLGRTASGSLVAQSSTVAGTGSVPTGSVTGTGGMSAQSASINSDVTVTPYVAFYTGNGTRSLGSYYGDSALFVTNQPSNNNVVIISDDEEMYAMEN